MGSIKAKQTKAFYSSLLPPKKTFQRLRTYPTHVTHISILLLGPETSNGVHDQ